MKQTVSTKWFLFSENDFSIEANMSEKNLKKMIEGIEIAESLGNHDPEIENIAFD